jgi:hypothetical protein
VKQVLGGVIDFIAGVFSGDWERAWTGIKNIFKGVVNAIITVVEAGINFIIDGVNGLVGAINAVLSLGDELFGKQVRISRVSKLALPRLAQGAVVPQNRQFAAILGDNKHETEVVSPLSTMKQALIEALQEAGGSDQPITILLDGEVIYRNVIRRNSQASKRTGRNPALIGG